MFSSAPSMSSSTSAFGSPLSFGQAPIGYPSPPFSTAQTSPFISTGYTPFSQTPATDTSRSPGTGFGFPTASGEATTPWGTLFSQTPATNTSRSFDFTTASGQATMPWGSTLSGDQTPFTASMSSSTSAFGPSSLFGQGPIGYPSPFSTAPSSPFICASSTGYTPFSQTTSTSRSPGTAFDFTTASAQATMPWGSTLSGGDQNPFAGSQVKAHNFGPSVSEKFSFGVNQGSRVTYYRKTTEFDDKGEVKMLVSISAMPAYSNKSHEELRWEDHHQFSDTGLGGGVVPAFARSRSTGLIGVFPSVPSSPFATTVTTPSIGQYPFLNHVPPSVPSSPFATTVTPPTFGQSLFMNHVKPNLEPVLDKMEEWEKSTQLICNDVKRVQKYMKSWMERDRSVELEKIKATQTINQLREELAHVTRSKDAIIAEYLASPAFTKRLDEEHEKRLSKIFHPCYVKALGEVQTKFPERNPFTFQSPATGWFPPSQFTTPFAWSQPPHLGHA